MVNKKQGALTGATAQVVALAYRASDFRDYLCFLQSGQKNGVGLTTENTLTPEIVFGDWLTPNTGTTIDYPTSSSNYEFTGLSIGERFSEGERPIRLGTRGEFNLRFAAVYKRTVSNNILDYTYEAIEINFPSPERYVLAGRYDIITNGDPELRLEFSSTLDALDAAELDSFSFALFSIQSLLNLTAHDSQTIFLSGTLIEFGGGHLSYDYDEYFTLKLEASPVPIFTFPSPDKDSGGELRSEESVAADSTDEDNTIETGTPTFMVGTPCPPHWRLVQE